MRKVNNLVACGIIYRRALPSEILIEMKDDGYPMAAFRRQLCLIGGNWIGDAAANDVGPRDLLTRELIEELSFDRPQQSTAELAELGHVDASEFRMVPTTREASASDVRELDELKKKIIAGGAPLGDFVNVIPRTILDTADPKNQREGFSVLVSYWVAGLDEDDWHTLTRLQERYGNLSNESLTLVTSLDEIIARGWNVAFGHDRVLQRFFLAMGLARAKDMPIVEDVESEIVGTSRPTFEDYYPDYEIARKPR